MQRRRSSSLGAPARDAASHADHLTNRFHVAVLLFSNRSQMTSKCGKNKKPDFDVFCDLLPNRRTAAWNLFVLYNKKKTKLPQKKAFFISKSFNTTGEPTFAHSAHFDKHRRKKAISRNLLSIQMKQSHSKRILIGSRKSRHCQT